MAEDHKIITQNLPDIFSPVDVRCITCNSVLDPRFTMDGRIKICIGMPMQGLAIPKVEDHRFLWAMHLKALEYRYPVKFLQASTGDIMVAYARELIADEALKQDCQFLLFVDDDMLFPLDIFERLYKRFTEVQADVVGALAFTRNQPHLPVVYHQIKGWDDKKHLPYYKSKTVEKYPRNALFECDGVGFGTVLIKTDILKKMERPLFMSTSGTGEDIYFCYEAKEAGARIFVDASVCSVHLGANVEIDEKFAEEKGLAKPY